MNYQGDKPKEVVVEKGVFKVSEEALENDMSWGGSRTF